jgi:hypothetical protein
MARYRCLDLKLAFAQCRVPKPLSRIFYAKLQIMLSLAT